MNLTSTIFSRLQELCFTDFGDDGIYRFAEGGISFDTDKEAIKIFL